MPSATAGGRPAEYEVEDVLDVFEQTDLPVVTARLVSERVGCSTDSAYRMLDRLVEQGELTRVELSPRMVVWFKADYEAAEQVADVLRSHYDLGDLDLEYIAAFAEQPYKMLPKGENEYYLVVPRFVPFQVGHLLEQDEAWKTFVVNKYVKWIESLPEEIAQRIDLPEKYENAIVENGELEVANAEERAEAWEEFSDDRAQHAIPPDDVLTDRDEWPHNKLRRLANRLDLDVGSNPSYDDLYRVLRNARDDRRIPLKKSREFDVIAGLIEDGNLPFRARAVDESDLRGEPESLTLREYQKRAWETFGQYGQVGVYWPMGLGKTFFGLYAGERVAGKKLVIVPSTTLEDQWETRIDEHCEHADEWEVRTYQYMTHGTNMQDYQDDDAPVLTIYDECHTLPANTFSKLATLQTKYRIGTSATPYREDDRTDYIFALTGVPVGMEWNELLEHADLTYPEVSLYLYNTENAKRRDLHDLVDEMPGKMLIYCDGLDAGHELAEELGVPFVHGETPKGERMDLIRDNRIVIGSRVADEGISLDVLDRIIEYDFHGKSRRQELQRAGRLMHTDGDGGHHIVQMTDAEFEKYSGRLLSLEEKGIRVQIERRA